MESEAATDPEPKPLRRWLPLTSQISPFFCKSSFSKWDLSSLMYHNQGARVHLLQSLFIYDLHLLIISQISILSTIPTCFDLFKTPSNFLWIILAISNFCCFWHLLEVKQFFMILSMEYSETQYTHGTYKLPLNPSTSLPLGKVQNKLPI